MRLDSVQMIRSEIKEIERRLVCLEALANSARVPVLDGLPRTKTQSSYVEKVATELIDLKNRRAALLTEMVDAILNLNDEIRTRLKDKTAAQILCYRYGHGYTFKRIEQETGLSNCSVFYFHKKGKQEFEKADEKKCYESQ